MSVTLGRRHRLLHVRTLLAKRNGEQEICPVHHGSPVDSQLLHKERATPRAPLREEARGSRVPHREFAQEEMQDEVLLGYPRPVHPQKKLVCTETIGGFVRTQLVPIRCQSGIDLTSSKHCQPCDSSKNQEDTAHQQRWQSYSSSRWNWQESWWHSSYEHHHEDGPSTD